MKQKVIKIPLYISVEQKAPFKKMFGSFLKAFLPSKDNLCLMQNWVIISLIMLPNRKSLNILDPAFIHIEKVTHREPRT